MKNTSTPTMRMRAPLDLEGRRRRAKIDKLADDRACFLRFDDPDNAVNPGPPRPPGEPRIPARAGWPPETRYLENGPNGPVGRRIWIWSAKAWAALTDKPLDSWPAADGSRFVIRAGI